MSETIRPGLAVMLTAALVGIGVFVGVLLYGPTPERPGSRGAGATGGAFGNGFGGGVQQQAVGMVGRGLDFAAISLLDEELRRTPDFAWGWMFAAQLGLRDRGESTLAPGMVERARANLARLSREGKIPTPSENSGDNAWFLAAWAAWGEGDEARSRELFLEGAARNAATNDPDSVGYLYNGACFLAMGGRTEEAMARIERLVETVGYNDPDWIARDPDLQPLHADPRFEEAMRALRDRERAEVEARRREGPEPSGEPADAGVGP